MHARALVKGHHIDGILYGTTSNSVTTSDALLLLRQCAYAAQPLRGSLAPEEAGVGRRHPWLSQGARTLHWVANIDSTSYTFQSVSPSSTRPRCVELRRTRML